MEGIFHQLFIREIGRRLFEEGFPRLKKYLGLLTEEEIWYRPNDNSNSVGNLILHLCGNVRQWLIAGMGGHPDTRQRQWEFDERGPIPTAELLLLLNNTVADARAVLNAITPEQLQAPLRIQGFEENGISVLVHVVEHFSCHVGQVTYFVKWKKNLSVGFYQGQNLDATGGRE